MSNKIEILAVYHWDFICTVEELIKDGCSLREIIRHIELKSDDTKKVKGMEFDCTFHKEFRTKAEADAYMDSIWDRNPDTEDAAVYYLDSYIHQLPIGWLFYMMSIEDDDMCILFSPGGSIAIREPVVKAFDKIEDFMAYLSLKRHSQQKRKLKPDYNITIGEFYQLLEYFDKFDESNYNCRTDGENLYLNDDFTFYTVNDNGDCIMDGDIEDLIDELRARKKDTEAGKLKTYLVNAEFHSAGEQVNYPYIIQALSLEEAKKEVDEINCKGFCNGENVETSAGNGISFVSIDEITEEEHKILRRLLAFS